MAQISRPFQIALLAMVVLAGVWFFALQGHSSSGGSSSTASAPAPAPTPSASVAAKKAAGAPTPVYHGAAPGVEGLSRAIANAHKAVATSEQNAKQLAGKSAQASSPTPTGGVTAASPAGTTSSPATAPKVSTAPRPAASTPATTKAVAPTKAKSPVSTPNRVPARQALVETQLKQGAVVAILFWNPHSAVDVAVQRELQLLLAVHHGLRKDSKNPEVTRLVKATGLELDSKIAVNEAPASQVASFGSITRAVQVYQTPTILILNKKGQTTTLTGLNDAFSIEQAMDEARHQ
jgi:uncharacterized protein (UPF0333 family)